MKHFLRRTSSAMVSAGLLISSFLAPAAPAQAATSCTVTYTTDGRPSIAPTSSGPGNGKRIGFDNTHGETAGQADWVIDGGFSDMACDLAGQGYTVEEIRAYPLTQANLSTYQAVVIPEPNIPLTTAEEGALESYVTGGGGLLLVADHYQADRNYNTWDPTEVFNGFRRGHYQQTYSSPAYWYNGVQSSSTYTFNAGNDWLAGAFGFRFRSNAMDLANAANAFGPGDPTDPSDPGILPANLTYGVTTAVNRVATYAGSTIAIVDPSRAIGVVYPNQGTLKRWANAQSNDPVALYTDNVGTPAGGAATYGGMAEGAYVAIAKNGAGKVAAAGDSSLWEDASPRYRKETDGTSKSTHDGWHDSDHAKLALNLVNWLATPDSTPSIDPALQQPTTPEPYSPFTLSEPLSEPWANPPAGYLWYDSRTFKPGSYNGTSSTTPPPTGTETWQWDNLPINAYPGNNLAVVLDVQGLTPSSSSTNQAYVYVTNGGTQLGSRYFRETNTYGFNTTGSQQTLQADATGKIKRWEFWQLANNGTTAARGISVRARAVVGSSTTNKVTSALTQAPAGGTYGTLKIESSLGYSDGLHAALFTKNGSLDTAVQVLKTTDTNVTLPPGTYSLEIQNDSTVKRTGVSVTILAGQTLSLAQVLSGGAGNPNASFSFSSIPANAYPGNRLALYLDGQNLAANTGYATDAYLSVTGTGQQISRRYDRPTQTFVGAPTAQTLTANASGEVHRWEFLDLDPASSIQEITARVRMNGTEKDAQQLTQLAASTYGYLTVESALGYSDGLHAALFATGSTLDTAVWLQNGANTTITLPPGTYTLEVRNDTTSKVSSVPVTITADQTVSLSQILNGGQPQAGWTFNQVPAHVYPGNRLGLMMDAQGVSPNNTYSVKGYVYVTGPGTQISKRYNRTTQTFVDGLTAQNMTTDGQGRIHGWEFWELTSSATRGISARITVDGAKKATENLQQVSSGAFGYLTIPDTMGFSDGLHALLASAGGSLDTTAWIGQGLETTVTLPAGTYAIAIWNDAGPELADVEVTIEAGKSISLATALDHTPPTVSGTRAPEANQYGWNNTDVTVTFTCADGESGIAECSQPVTVTTEGRDQQVSGRATDNRGNTAESMVAGISIDKTAPETEASTPDGWSKGDVTIALTATDALSGALQTYFTIDGGAEQTGNNVVVSGDGTHTVRFWSLDQAGNTEEPKSLSVAIDLDPPTITADRSPANESGWNNTDVTVTFTCEDSASGIAACSAPMTVTDEGTSQSVLGTATDNAGNTASLTVKGISIDKSAPVTTATAPAGWSNSAVTVTLSPSDNLSGVGSTHFTVDGGAEQTGTSIVVGDPGLHTVSYWSLDRAGNLEGPQSLTLQIDVNPPTITADRTPANEQGWNNSDVTVTFACEDGDSGIATCSEPVTLTDEGKDLSATGSATDNAGNTASLTVTKINIDRTAPTLTIAGARAYTVDEMVNITCSAVDTLSGLAVNPCATPLLSVPAYTLALGAQTVQAVAVDRAGNRIEGSAEFTIAVTYQSLSNLTKQMVTKKLLATSLAATLKAAEIADGKGNIVARNALLNAYNLELQGAQKAKLITAETASLLQTLALALQN